MEYGIPYSKLLPTAWAVKPSFQSRCALRKRGRRRLTGDDWTIDVLVMAMGINRSISFERTWARATKQSSPVTRSHSSDHRRRRAGANSKLA
jgi:hypothetical protein